VAEVVFTGRGQGDLVTVVTRGWCGGECVAQFGYVGRDHCAGVDVGVPAAGDEPDPVSDGGLHRDVERGELGR
jgi:hypothetical protein